MFEMKFQLLFCIFRCKKFVHMCHERNLIRSQSHDKGYISLKFSHHVVRKKNIINFVFFFLFISFFSTFLPRFAQNKYDHLETNILICDEI